MNTRLSDSIQQAGKSIAHVQMQLGALSFLGVLYKMAFKPKQTPQQKKDNPAPGAMTFLFNALTLMNSAKNMTQATNKLANSLRLKGL